MYDILLAIPCVDLAIPASDILMSNCTGNSFTGVVGSVCQFSCDVPGYELEGSAFRQCLADRTWSGTVTSCARMKCPAILIQHSGVLPSCTQEFNNTCLVHCLPGYSISDPHAVSGVSAITCELTDDLSSTQWNKDLMCIGKYKFAYIYSVSNHIFILHYLYLYRKYSLYI